MRSCTLPVLLPPTCLAALCIAAAAPATAFIPSSAAALQHRRRPLHVVAADATSNNTGSNDNALICSADKRKSQEGHKVEVSYEGRTINVAVRPNETILMALERTGAADELCVSSFPQDCRRGNCLTCTGRIKEGTASSANLVRGEDGLAPHVSKDLARKGYVLTCSSFVVGEGLKVELGQNADVWEDTYRKRYENSDSEKVGMHAQAKLLRLVAEGDVPKWTKETEETLERS
mmetsp:Transcript_3702/g.8352  ORF Transcript_3702/g.8352 Transcript_3702/m.8352 type:complete len:233 (+) Transcript_3702:106-804(+)